jgi:hypothetical protein
VCNYCRFWEAHDSRLLDVAARRGGLARRFQAFSGRGDHDVLVGLSGGKDSAFVLHRLLTDYPVRLLAVTFDNGFLTPYATRSVDAIVRATGAEHRMHRPEWPALRAFYRATLLRLGEPCVACSIGGYVLAIKACAEMGVPFFVHGRSPMQMFRSAYAGSRDPGLRVARQSLRGYRPAALRWQYRRLGWTLRALLRAIEPRRAVRRQVFDEFFRIPLSRHHVVPEFLGFFLFEPYDEESIKAYLETHSTGYRRPEGDVLLGHADCLIHDACDHLYRLRYGVSKRRIELAMMRRHGLVTAEEAARIEARNTPSPEQVDASVEVLLDALELSRSAFDELTVRLSRERRANPLA